MRAIILWGMLVSGSVGAQNFDQVDWRQSAALDTEGEVILFNPTPTVIDAVRITEVARVAFDERPSRMGIVAFDCATPSSSSDLQWGTVSDGRVTAPLFAAKDTPFGLRATSRSTLATDETWAQVCEDAVSQAFPQNVLWDEAVQHIRLTNKSWRKSFPMSRLNFAPLDKQYRALPVEQAELKRARLRDKMAERAWMRAEAQEKEKPTNSVVLP